MLIVKEVNAPAAAPFAPGIFPVSRYILLVRDPYDVLDSHIDMQRPGAWNADFWQDDQASWSYETRVEFLATHIRRSFELAQQGFDACRPGNRLRLSYEELLGDPFAELSRCAQFLGLTATDEDLRAAVSTNRFERFEGRKGRARFRRYGRAGTWRNSPNFSPAVQEIAERVLGPLRAILGYADGSDLPTGPASAPAKSR